METLEKHTLPSPKTAEIGAYRKISPRLHKNDEADNASALLNGCSVQRRFSPRLHKNCTNIATTISRKPGARGTFSPNLHKSAQRCPLGSSTYTSALAVEHIITPPSLTDSKTQTAAILRTDPNFHRRLSPRLHNGVADEKRQIICNNSGIPVGKNADLSSSYVNQVQRRHKSRFHKIHEDGERECDSEKSLSSRIHNDGQREKQTSISNGCASKKRPYSRLQAKIFDNAKRRKVDDTKDTGCENNVSSSRLNGIFPAANDEPPGEITIRSKLFEKKSWIDGAPVIAGRRIRAGVKKTLRIFNEYRLQFVQEKEERRKKNETEKQKTSRFLKSKVQSVQGCLSKGFQDLPGLVCCDISNGQEVICIPVTNLFDDATIDEGFTYIRNLEVAESVNLPPTTAGCACKGICTNRKTCSCAKLNGSDFPYVRHDGGRLIEAKDVVFECGPNCSCGPMCLNRTSQREIKYHLEVYRTPNKGWAVRSWDFIPSGAPICEYVGLLRRSDEVDNIYGNDFIFEIDCWHTMNEIEGRERRFGNVAVSATDVFPNINKKTLECAPEFCIDAGSRGNVSRFMNHSCEPNLFVQCVLSAHHDLRLARLIFFAAENIPPLQELTYDYGYALNSVVGPEGEVKALPCFCGTADCRKRLY